MVYKSTITVEVPQVDLLSWVFGGDEYDDDRPIYIDALNPARHFTRAQSLTLVRKLISGLRALGVQKGDSVLIQSFSDIAYPLLILGIIGAGGIFVGANPSSTTHELTSLITLTSTRYVIVAPCQLPVLLLVTRNPPITPPIPDSNILILNTPHDPLLPPAFPSWTTLLTHSSSPWHPFTSPSPSQSPPAAHYQTSGTTGLPKLASLSHHACIARCISSSSPAQKKKEYEVKRLLYLPMFHCLSLTAAHLEPLRRGVPTYVLPRFQRGWFVEGVRGLGVSETVVVPAVIALILGSGDGEVDAEATREALKSLRHVRCAGAPLDRTVQGRLLSVLHEKAVLGNAWGLTEAGSVTGFWGGEVDGSGSCGRLLANTEAMIVDAEGKEVIEDGFSGEVLVRGPSLMSGYLGDTCATEDAFVDGWLKTGDVAFVKGGKWYIVGRSKDMIKVRGWQVSPTELESVLKQHPSVLDVSVIGVKSRSDQTELPRAYVIRKDGVKGVTEDDLKMFLRERLASYKALDGGVRFVDALPKTSTGKILKRVLREQAEMELVTNV